MQVSGLRRMAAIKKIVLLSNSPAATSGYGTQAALLLPRLAALGHEVTVFAPFSGGSSVTEWQGFRVLPPLRDIAGCDALAEVCRREEAGLLLTLCDPFRLLGCAPDLARMPVAHWFPVDCQPCSTGDVAVLRDGQGIPVAMSRHGEEMLRREGCDPLYVPHGVEADVFCPGDPEPSRAELPGVGPDTFVIGICGLNRGIRKGLPGQLQAFARFRRRHPDSHLALHTSPYPRPGEPGTSLPLLAGGLEISDAVSYPDAFRYDMGLYSREDMARWFRGLDVLSLCSYGEGFGLPLAEAQACGIPVITTLASAMTELCGSGWLVAGSDHWEEGHGSWWVRPDPASIEAGYEAAWQAREDGKMPALRARARTFALQYEVDAVFDQRWKPALDEIAERIR